MNKIPTFPKPDCDIPDCLKLSNIKHYFLLVYWVYFRPNLLRYYFYQSDPELYRAGAGKNIFKTLHNRHYRNAYLLSIVSSALLSILVSFSITIIVHKMFQQSIIWDQWWLGIILGIILNVILAVSFAILLGLIISFARGVMVGTIMAMIDCLSFSLVCSISLSFVSTQDFVNTLSNLSINLIVGVFFGIAVGVCMMVFIVSESKSAIVGILISLILGLNTGIVGSIIHYMLSNLLNNYYSNLTFALVFGLAAFGSHSGAANIVESFLYVFVFSFFIAIGVAFQHGILMGLITLGIALILSWRIPLYILEIICSLLSPYTKIKHPIEWDEIIFFPLPNTQLPLVPIFENLDELEHQNLIYLANLMSNNLQRWLTQKILKSYLLKNSYPLKFLYDLASKPLLKKNLTIPDIPDGWKKENLLQKILLSELVLEYVNHSSDNFNILIEKITYNLTYFLRDHTLTSINRFAELLYTIIDQEKVNQTSFYLSKYEDVYSGLDDYTGGIVIKQTFTLIAHYLNCQTLDDFTKTSISLTDYSSENSIRIEIIECLREFAQIKQKINTYLNSIVWSNKQSALLRIPDELKQLEHKIDTEINSPEKFLLKRIIKQWNELIIEESGKVGRCEINQEIPNPYIAGNPVTGELFFGREDIFKELNSLWNKDGQCSSVVLYGHRRMGKSSILQNLQDHLKKKENIIIVDFNLQFIGNLQNTSQFLYLLAREIYYAFDEKFPNRLMIPQREQFEPYPNEPFRRFLDELNRVRENHKFIVTLDEFEILENLINKNKIEKEILSFLKAIFQKYQWLIMAFAGLHTLQEMTYDYWHPLFAGVKPIKVSFLSNYSAMQLIQNPIPISYTEEAINHIIQLTNNQPFLIQVICQELVQKYNEFLMEGRKISEFTLEMVESIVNNPEFFSQMSMANGYFNGVWEQAMYSSLNGQLDILRQLCHHPLSLTEIIDLTQLDTRIVEKSLNTLQEHDVIKQENNFYYYTVELMCRWVKINHG